MAFVQTYKKHLVTGVSVWGVCLFIFALAYLLVLMPLKDSQERADNLITQKKETYESALKAAQEEEKSKQLKQIELLQDNVGDFAIDYENSANLTFDISQMANDKNVTMFNIKGNDNNKTSAIPNCSYINEGHLNIDFDAEFNQFAIFLNDLERHRPVLFIDTFSINRSGQDDASYQASLDVAVFVIKQPSKKNDGKS